MIFMQGSLFLFVLEAFSSQSLSPSITQGVSITLALNMYEHKISQKTKTLVSIHGPVSCSYTFLGVTSSFLFNCNTVLTYVYFLRKINWKRKDIGSENDAGFTFQGY